jgi:hypothetical protein
VRVKPENIADEVYKAMLPEMKKIYRIARGEELYSYAAGEHVLSQAVNFR